MLNAHTYKYIPLRIYIYIYIYIYTYTYTTTCAHACTHVCCFQSTIVKALPSANLYAAN